MSVADHSTVAPVPRKMDLIMQQCPDEDVVVVAHSIGAVPVAPACAAGALAASHVVLIEPALYDVARGHHAIERHVSAMNEARERAGMGDLFGFWQIVAPLMFGGPATSDGWQDDEPVAQRFADIEPPWGHGIRASVFDGVPTLVVTGDWNLEYEAIAAVLDTAGARHVHLRGAKHRPQDHSDFESVLGALLDD